MALIATIPAYHNSSPNIDFTSGFVNRIDTPFTLFDNFSDPDGDSLSFSLCSTLTGGSISDPAPNPPSYPSGFVPLANGYSAQHYLGNDSIAINDSTGIITGLGHQQGNFLIGICVSEYRAGQLITTYPIDMQITIAPC